MPVDVEEPVSEPEEPVSPEEVELSVPPVVELEDPVPDGSVLIVLEDELELLGGEEDEVESPALPDVVE